MTATSSFGASRRESHDATNFYKRFPPLELSSDDEVVECTVKDRLFLGDSRHMEKVQSKSVALVVTSPAYYVGKTYEIESEAAHVPTSYVEYLAVLTDVFAECHRVLEPGGRIAVNVANLGRKPYRSLSGDIVRILQDELGFLLRGEIVWQKGVGVAGNCAWGSFQSPSNPVLRDLTERVVVASKGRFDRAPDTKTRAKNNLPHESTISKENFMAWTLDVWQIAPESATKVGHPAPFPVELPRRLIELYTYRDDVVLDPFMGSGTTAVASVETNRHYVGFDADKNYVALAKDRIEQARKNREENAA